MFHILFTVYFLVVMCILIMINDNKKNQLLQQKYDQRNKKDEADWQIICKGNDNNMRITLANHW